MSSYQQWDTVTPIRLQWLHSQLWKKRHLREAFMNPHHTEDRKKKMDFRMGAVQTDFDWVGPSDRKGRTAFYEVRTEIYGTLNGLIYSKIYLLYHILKIDIKYLWKST